VTDRESETTHLKHNSLPTTLNRSKKEGAACAATLPLNAPPHAPSYEPTRAHKRKEYKFTYPSSSPTSRSSLEAANSDSSCRWPINWLIWTLLKRI
jgi:hypothetical protein